MSTEHTSGQLFVPGRASYLEDLPDGEVQLHLSEASAHRAMVARGEFDEEFHESALFAGGYPGVAQGWEQEPPADQREAYLMALPLERRLQRYGWSSEVIKARILRQGDSNNSIGDVAESMAQGHLNINDFHKDLVTHRLDLITGALHGRRFRMILQAALDPKPDAIRRVRMRDVYGTTTIEGTNQPAEAAPVAVAKEMAAIAITSWVLRDVKPGSIESLREAETRFNGIAAKLTS